jgi:uncharacterized protein YciI
MMPVATRAQGLVRPSPGMSLNVGIHLLLQPSVQGSARGLGARGGIPPPRTWIGSTCWICEAPIGASSGSLIEACPLLLEDRVGYMEFVVFYATKDPSRLSEVYPRHHAYVEAFAREGGLLAIGTFDDPVANGSMAVFDSRQKAEEFLAHDPFVTEAVVDPSGIREWNVLTFR